MPRKKGFQWRNLIRFEFIVGFIIVAVAIYFAWRAKKSKYSCLTTTFQREDVPKRAKRGNPGTTSKGERYAKMALEGIFSGKEFAKIRPEWLKNPATGKCLEIDLFNSDIVTPIGRGLGVEIDGIQHAMMSPHFHRTSQDFLYQCKKDRYKDKVCHERGIMLIRVPHFIVGTRIEEYLSGILRKKGVI